MKMNLDGKRILIVKPSSLGDVVHTLPLAHAIKREFPSSHMGWIIQKAFSPLIDNDSSVDEVIPISIPSTSDPNAKRWVMLEAAKATILSIIRLKKQFSLRPYDIVLDLHASFRSAMLGKCNPNGLRIGFSDAKELNTYFQRELVAPDPAKPHAIDKNLQFALYLGVSVRDTDFRIEPGPIAEKEARNFLGGNVHNKPVIYANPAARWVTKHWSTEQWASLGDALISLDHATFILAGGPGDLGYIETITSKMKHRPLVSAGKISLAASMALSALSDAYVGVDSGPMHFAAMAGAKVVALFGPTDPKLVGPYGKNHIVIQRTDLECLSCRKRHCETMECLHGIKWEEVYNAVKQIIRA